MDSDVGRGRSHALAAEKATDKKEKYLHYIAASKCYSAAAATVCDQVLIRSLLYLSSSYASKAILYSGLVDSSFIATPDPMVNVPSEKDGPMTETEAAEMLYSGRLIYKAHIERIGPVDKVPTRATPDIRLVKKDLDELEAMLAKVGFRKDAVMKESALLPSTQTLLSKSSHHALTSDLGESFMVLDLKSKKQQQQQQYGNSRARGVGGGILSGHAIGKGHAIDGSKIDLENKMVQSIVNTSHMSQHLVSSGRSQPLHHQQQQQQQQQQQPYPRSGDGNSITPSQSAGHVIAVVQPTTTCTNSNAAEATIISDAGVINLLDTVKRLGDENSMLIKKLENLAHVEEQSVETYRNIEQFKRAYREKFDTLKEILCEYAESRSGGGGGASGGGGGGGGGVITLSDPTMTASRLLSSTYSTSSTAWSTISSPSSPRPNTGAAATSGSTNSSSGKDQYTSVVNSKNNNEGNVDDPSSIDRSSIHRQQQLEKAVKALVMRVEKAHAEIKKKNELLEKYVDVINKLKAQLQGKHKPGSSGSASGSASGASNANGGAASYGRHTPTSNRSSSTSTATAMAIAGGKVPIAGSTVSTYYSSTHHHSGTGGAVAPSRGTGTCTGTGTGPTPSSSTRARSGVSGPDLANIGAAASSTVVRTTTTTIPTSSSAAVNSAVNRTVSGVRPSVHPSPRHHSATTLEALRQPSAK